ncbi:unnamed protein product [Auanema sp. JU1783]|nr:unnamed protein product [Auanema sp. JU1783]
MDIKSYFTKQGSKKYSTPNTSVLSSIRKEIQQESPSRSKPNKKRSDRLNTTSVRNVNVDDVVLELDSDGESPIPSSLRKSMAPKRPNSSTGSGERPKKAKTISEPELKKEKIEKTIARSPHKKEVLKEHKKENSSDVRKLAKEDVTKRGEKQKVSTETRKDVVRESSKSETKKVDSAVDVPWVDKYRPKSLAQLVGQHGEKSPLNKLLHWLKEWPKHNLGEGAKIKKPKPSPFATQTDGTPFKAALLSGTPGVGKTSSAHLACESLGLKFVEMNASDVRNKKHLEAQIAQLTGSHQIEEYFGKKNSDIHAEDNKVHHVLVMDEVDGMSGNEDRAGIAELIQIIKDTKIPIICICNDRSHPKIRSLSNHCFDLRFPKPRVEQIRSRIMTIACQEKIKVSKEELDEIIELSGHDVRQTIYNLQIRGLSSGSELQKKDCAINTFDAARRLLDSRASLTEKQEMFFVDYNIMPLFVHENYPNMKNEKHKNLDAIRGLRKAAELISYGDVADKCLRTTGAWKLLNEQCMLGCALPSIAVGGHLKAMIQFPAWLGKNSTANKRQRMMRQLASHAQLKVSANTQSLVTDYVPVLRDRLTKPLLTEESNGVQAVIDVMTEYDLIKDDSEAIAELAVWPGRTDPAAKIQSKVKSALTRALNKSSRMLPYATEDITKGKKKKVAGSTELEIDEEGNLVERGLGDEEDNDEEETEEEEKAVAKVITNTGKSARGKATTRGRGGRGRGK